MPSGEIKVPNPKLKAQSQVSSQGEKSAGGETESRKVTPPCWKFATLFGTNVGLLEITASASAVNAV
ncbi:MAG: hypothetical protein WCH99_20410 [Verrucomicrobiota bacterium]